MYFKYLIYVYLLNFVLISCQERENQEIDQVDPEVFIPTNEWQTIRPNQPIPKGLHVRINLQTGLKEAKLLSETERENNAKSLLVIPNEDETSKSEDENFLDRARIKKALHNIKPDDISSTQENQEPHESKFRSFDTLRKEFAELNLTIKTDLEIMNTLFEEYVEVLKMHFKSPHELSVEDKLINILTDLEYLVHQIDNAREFVKSDGLSKIVMPSLNATSPKVRTEIIKLLGSAAQSNARVQIAALEAGVISVLLRTFALEREHSVRSAALFALSCLVRRFPIAQLELIKQGGLAVFTTLFDEQAESSQNLKLQMKVITLMYDLIIENHGAVVDVETALNVTSANMTDEKLLEELNEKNEKLRQYNLVNLESKLVEHNWCDHLSQILIKQSMVAEDRTERRDDMSSAIGDLPVRFEHDIIEKILECISVIFNKCSENFQSNTKLHQTLFYLDSWYKNLATKESNSDSNYYTNLFNIVNDLNVRLSKNGNSLHSSLPKEEL